MRFKAAVIFSVILHASLFAIAIFGPAISGGKPGGTPYYVRWANISGGGGGGGPARAKMRSGSENTKADSQATQTAPQRMKDLTTQKQAESKLRYPDQDKKIKKQTKPKPEKQSLITMTRKDTDQDKKKPGSPVTVTRKTANGTADLRTGLSIGSDDGSGDGSGSGSGGGFGNGSGGGDGDGTGFGSGDFPYAYYISAIRSKISASWYNALISPGRQGRYVAVVFFKILRNGQVADVNVESKSGLDSLDLSALRAVENAVPFPPLPGDYPYSYLGVHFEFEWEK